MTYPRTESADHRIDPALGDALPAAVDLPPNRKPAPNKSPIVWLLLLVVVAGAAAAFYLWRQNEPRTPPVAPAPSAATPPSPSAEIAPAIQHPIEDAQKSAEPGTEAKPLPALAVSDTTMQNSLAALFGDASLGKVFYEDQIIHRFVATIDNLPRKTVPARYLPIKPVGGGLAIAGKDDNMSITPDNAARYTPYVRIADAIDAKKLVAVYVHFYPLMQQDYRDLGYPKGYFNDRLIEAIDDMLAAPDVQGPMLLVQPKVLYQFADAGLESRSAGQKIIMRMGSDNAAKVKAKLREIRRELTGAP